MTLPLKTFLAIPELTAADVDRFLAGNRFPVVEGRKVTFVYRGVADAVNLRCWVAGFAAAQPFQRLGATDLWTVAIDLAPGSRIEYKFEVIAGGQTNLIVDPLNPVLADDPFGANSVCQAEGYERPAWTEERDDVRRGSWERVTIDSSAFGDQRALNVYLPSRFRRSRSYSLLVVHDGNDYLRYAQLGVVLDNLIHDLEIPPLIVALSDSPDRLTEYAGDRRHAQFICNEVLSVMSERYPLIDDSRSRCLMGASFGAVASLHAAWLNPGLFDRLLLQSGSFAFSDIGRHKRGPAFDPVVAFVNRFRESPGHPAKKVFLSCGLYESLIFENRSMVLTLQQQSIDVLLEEARDAHNWENWRDRLRSGLTWLFPGPAWMVYE
ncbi:MAG: alpha/beta hydrolase-fold protein [Pseudomonadota bacterium]